MKFDVSLYSFFDVDFCPLVYVFVCLYAYARVPKWIDDVDEVDQTVLFPRKCDLVSVSLEPKWLDAPNFFYKKKRKLSKQGSGSCEHRILVPNQTRKT